MDVPKVKIRNDDIINGEHSLQLGSSTDRRGYWGRNFVDEIVVRT